MRTPSPRYLVARAWLGMRGVCPHVEVIDASWHVDTEAICPDCLEWIHPGDYVRRNAFDMVQHEVCPPVCVRQNRA